MPTFLSRSTREPTIRRAPRQLGTAIVDVFWQSFGQMMIGTTAHFEGIALCETAIVLGTGSTVNGRLLAQTAVTLDQSVVTQPAP